MSQPCRASLRELLMPFAPQGSLHSKFAAQSAQLVCKEALGTQGCRKLLFAFTFLIWKSVPGCLLEFMHDQGDRLKPREVTESCCGFTVGSLPCVETKTPNEPSSFIYCFTLMVADALSLTILFFSGSTLN